MTERTTMQALSSALRFAASRSAISSAEERAIREAWNNTRTPAPASDGAMEVWRKAVFAYGGQSIEGAEQEVYAARIIQQYRDEGEAAGYRRGIEAAAKIPRKRMEERFEEYGTREYDTNATYYEGRCAELYECLDEEDEAIEAECLALLETKEAGWEREEWMRRYTAYLSHLGWQPYELERMAFNAWESWPDDDPEEIASSDLHCMRSDGHDN